MGTLPDGSAGWWERSWRERGLIGMGGLVGRWDCGPLEQGGGNVSWWEGALVGRWASENLAWWEHELMET
jgi:hypothetical protein